MLQWKGAKGSRGLMHGPGESLDFFLVMALFNSLDNSLAPDVAPNSCAVAKNRTTVVQDFSVLLRDVLSRRNGKASALQAATIPKITR